MATITALTSSGLSGVSLADIANGFRVESEDSIVVTGASGAFVYEFGGTGLDTPGGIIQSFSISFGPILRESVEGFSMPKSLLDIFLGTNDTRAFLGTILSGADVFNGSTNADTFDGQKGSDELNGNDGDDFLYGDLANDTLNGGAGDDRLEGGAGDDTLDGGDGNDMAAFSRVSGDYVVEVGGNTVTVTGPDGTDTLTGIEQLLFRDGLVDVDYGSPSGGTAGDDFLNGTPGDDTIDALGGKDRIFGGAGDDSIDGGAGNDSASGEDGNDTLFASEGEDRLDGGAGIDTADFGAATSGVTVDLLANRPQNVGGGLDKENLISIENVMGSDFDDMITGDAAANMIMGLAGNDTIIGNAGDDSLFGYTGDDFLKGGLGDDTLFASAGNDKLEGGSGLGDTADFSLATSRVTVSLGTNRVQNVGGGLDNEQIVNVENLTGSDYDDKLTGSSGVNVLTGGLGADVLKGGAGDDVYAFRSAAESTGASYDRIDFFDFSGNEKIMLPFAVSDVEAVINAGALSPANLDAGLAAAVTALGENHAVGVNVTGGKLAGKFFLVVDANGVAGYQSGGDYVIGFGSALNTGALDTGDFTT